LPGNRDTADRGSFGGCSKRVGFCCRRGWHGAAFRYVCCRHEFTAYNKRILRESHDRAQTFFMSNVTDSSPLAPREESRFKRRRNSLANRRLCSCLGISDGFPLAEREGYFGTAK
jgi:hypothetical protein